MTALAALGGTPAFPDGLQFARPAMPDIDLVTRRLMPSYNRGMITNGAVVREFEEAAAAWVGVDHAVAVSSCTAGLMLVLRCLGISKPVVLPSFTFSASAHAVAWNGLGLRFAECDQASFHLDLDDATARLDGAGAVLATHVFGAPCQVEELADVTAAAGVPLLFDAAHAFGAEHRGVRVGRFGTAEVFSLSATKLVVAGEGGLVTTGDGDLAERLRVGREYGNPGDYNSRFVGLNARMSEMHAAIAIESLALLDAHLERRAQLAAAYRSGLAEIPGITVQRIATDDTSTYKDFTIAVDERFGLTRDEMVIALRAEGIDTRNYFSPPVHQHTAYAGVSDALPVTDLVASRVVSLPMFRDLPDAAVKSITTVIARLHQNATEVRATLAAGDIRGRASVA